MKWLPFSEIQGMPICLRGESGPQMLADIRPNEDHAKQYIELPQLSTVVQVMPEMSEHEVPFLFLYSNVKILSASTQHRNMNIRQVSPVRFVKSVQRSLGRLCLRI